MTLPQETVLEKVRLGVPENLTLVGDKASAFLVELLEPPPRGFQVSCRIKGRPESEQPFVGGKVRMLADADQRGELVLALRLTDPSRGVGLEGWTSIPLKVQEQGLREVYGDGHAIYQGDREPVLTVGKRSHVQVSLYPLEPNGVLLEDLVDREEILPLVEKEGRLRVLSLHVGPHLVVGRCYSQHLNDPSRQRLRRSGASRVHWASAWDDDRVNRIVARLVMREADNGAVEGLEVENLTDYSHTPQSLRFENGGEVFDVGAGESRLLRLEAGDRFQLVVGQGSRRRDVVRLRYEEMTVGHTQLPVLTSEGTRFPFPPDDPAPKSIAFLGAWIPRSMAQFERHLEAMEKQTMEVRFLKDGVNLSLAWAAERGAVVVHSNEDLSRALDPR